MDEAEALGCLRAWLERGEEPAFVRLCEGQRRWLDPLLLGWARGDPELAADLRQEYFVALLRALPRYRGGGSLGGFCYRLAANLARDELRARARRSRREARAGAREEAGRAAEADPAEALVGREEAAALAARARAALAGLPAADRALLLLRSSAGFEYEELADLLGTGAPALRQRFARARRRFEARFKEADDGRN